VVEAVCRNCESIHENSLFHARYATKNPDQWGEKLIFSVIFRG
jgi:hypothetical protein